ncbi:MAG: substrate-binding domain-containing protein [Algicola sp.]|nr:substrate-binding domain-containing protein [Algicola sp.]
MTVKPLYLYAFCHCSRLFWFVALILTTSMLSFNLSASTVTLQSWLNPFDSDSSKRTINYQWETPSNFKQRICAIIPSSSTSYWFALNYGLVKKARAMGVTLKVYNINGNLSLSKEKQLIEQCIGQKPHSIIIGAQLSEGIDQSQTPNADKSQVIAVGKNLFSKTVDASSSASFTDVGQQLSKYMNKRHTGESINQTVLFPGDKTGQHVEAFVKGFTPNINGNKYKVEDIIYTPDSYLEIKIRLTNYLNNNLNTTTVVASALVAQAAVEVLDEMSLTGDIQIFSYELSAQVYRGIQRGNISASFISPPVIQGFLAIDMAMKLHNNQLKEPHISPIATLIDSDNITDFDISQVFAPYGYRETLEVN